MYKKIIDLKNFQEAYLRLADKLLEDGIGGSYAGWDALKIGDLEVSSDRVVKEARQELIDLKALSPAILLKIPKKSNPQKLREIYIYNLKERIKAQAIYQIVEPFFDNFFSPWLFSYRSSHGSYFAARSTVRHYGRHYGRDSVLIGDLADYSSFINQNELRKKLDGLGLAPAVLDLMGLFIGNKIIRAGRIESSERGLVQGVPLIALFNNLYLDEFDKNIGPRVDFYRRVGDDFIVFDRREKILIEIKGYLEAEAQRLGLKINQEKTKLMPAKEPFSFLGYYFADGLVSLEKKFCQALIKKWQGRFSYYRFRQPKKKLIYLKKSVRGGVFGLEEQFRQIAEQKKLVNDIEQIKNLSEAFFRVLTRYFYKNYSERNRRLLEKKIKNIRFYSLYKIFTSNRHGKDKRTS